MGAIFLFCLFRWVCDLFCLVISCWLFPIVGLLIVAALRCSSLGLMFSDLLLLCLIMCIGMSYVFWLFLRATFVDDCCCWFDCCVLLDLRCVCIGGLVLELIVVACYGGLFGVFGLASVGGVLC